MSKAIDLRGGNESAGAVTAHVTAEHATVDVDLGGDAAPSNAQMEAAFTTALGTVRFGTLRNTNGGINRAWHCWKDATGWHAVTDNAAGTLPAAVVGPHALGTGALQAAAGDHTTPRVIQLTTPNNISSATAGAGTYAPDLGLGWNVIADPLNQISYFAPGVAYTLKGIVFTAGSATNIDATHTIKMQAFKAAQGAAGAAIATSLTATIPTGTGGRWVVSACSEAILATEGLSVRAIVADGGGADCTASYVKVYLIVEY